MEFGIWIVAVVVLGLAAVAASGRLGEMPGTVTDTPAPQLPTGPLSSVDLRGVRFAVVPRGYSMKQVDELLDRLAIQLGSASFNAAPSPTQPQAYSTYTQPESSPEQPASQHGWADVEEADYRRWND